MTDHEIHQVRLNVRVAADVKRRYEEEIRETHGKTNGYAGYEIENELRAHFGRGRIGTLVDAVHELAEELGEITRKNKIQMPDRGETELVQYRVAEPLKERLDNIAGGEYASRGEFVERLMHRYYADGGTIQKAANRMDRIREAAKQSISEAADPVERRTQTLVNALGGEDTHGFTLDEFSTALDAAAQGVNDSSYARQKYLPKVLDHLGFTWHPENTRLFVPADKIQAGDQDPQAKPYILMDDEDRQMALRYHLAADGSAEFVTVEDAVDVLQGRPQRTTARQDLRAIGNLPGFDYVSADDRTADGGKDGLTVSTMSKVMNAPEHGDLRDHLPREAATTDNNRASGVQGNGTTTESGDTDDTPAEWVTEAAEQIPKPIRDDPPTAVVSNKIARVKWPSEVENGEVSQAAVEHVTNQQRQLVYAELVDDATDGPDLEAKTEAKFDQSMNAVPTKAATDRGEPINSD